MAQDLLGAIRRLLAPGPQLSPGERDVLRLLATGLGVAQIAQQLSISESTTKTHISRLYEKLGAGNPDPSHHDRAAARLDRPR